jgi:hypothetical protein
MNPGNLMLVSAAKAAKLQTAEMMLFLLDCKNKSN